VTADTHAAAMHRVREAILETPGETDAALRRAIAAGETAEPPLGPYLEQVARHAYRIGDADVERLRDAGYSDAAIFELTLAAALGAAELRLAAGLQALEE
jgi:alkylhydroperoxidase family enzyme